MNPLDENVNNDNPATHLASSLRAAPPPPLRPAFRRRLGLVAPFDAFAPPSSPRPCSRASSPRTSAGTWTTTPPRPRSAWRSGSARGPGPSRPPPGPPPGSRSRTTTGRRVPFLPRRLRPRGEPVARVRRGGGAVAAAMPGGPRRPAVGVCVRLRPDGHGQVAHDHGPGGVVARGRASRAGAVSSRRRRRPARRARRRGYARRVLHRLGVSSVEFYFCQGFDLLDDHAQVDVRDGEIVGRKQAEVKTLEDALDVMATVRARRTTASTKMNPAVRASQGAAARRMPQPHGGSQPIALRPHRARDRREPRHESRSRRHLRRDGPRGRRAPVE